MTGGKHADDDGDRVINQDDPDWAPPDERDEHALLDHELDPHQAQPDRWTGVTRGPDALPATEAVAADG